MFQCEASFVHKHFIYWPRAECRNIFVLLLEEDESEVYDKLADPEGAKKEKVQGDTQQVGRNLSRSPK